VNIPTRITKDLAHPERTLTNEEGDVHILRPTGLFAKIKRRMIGRAIYIFINRAYERGFINSRALHELHAMSDRCFL
jgi:hypothetical protein